MGDNMAYQPSHRLRGGARTIQVGDRLLSVTTTHYSGWDAFRASVLDAMGAVRQTNLIRNIERFSFRYINVLNTGPGESQLALLNLRVDLVGHPPEENGFLLRTEIKEDGLISVVQIAPNASAKASIAGTAQEATGLLVDIDTITLAVPTNFFADPAPALDKAHRVLERTFFSLLTSETLARLEPEW
jgi:uncharacterized protein (TIGR04255 family)